MFEETNGCEPRYITMNWRNFREVCKEKDDYPKQACFMAGEPRVFGMEIFINPCITDSVIHLTFDRMN